MKETPANPLARDVMSSPVVTAPASSTVRSVASLMLERGVSAIPIVDDSGAPIGMTSDGDLLGRRSEDTLRHWWLSLLAEGATSRRPLDFKVERSVREVMSAPLIQVDLDTSVQKIAELLQTHRIKRVPVVLEGKVVGIVSRSDLLFLIGRIPVAQTAEDSGAGLLSFLESMIGGVSLRGVSRKQGGVHEEAAPAAARSSVLSADALRAEVHAYKEETVDKRQSARREAALERRREIKALLDHHVSEALWREMLAHAELAAKNGDQELMLLRFPSDLCSDGGRRVDVAEAGWEETLRGEAAEIYDRWRKELRPRGFGLSARVVSYDEGILGDVGLYLTWGE